MDRAFEEVGCRKVLKYVFATLDLDCRHGLCALQVFEEYANLSWIDCALILHHIMRVGAESLQEPHQEQKKL